MHTEREGKDREKMDKPVELQTNHKDFCVTIEETQWVSK